MNYPIFLRLKKTSTFYKITSDHSFRELKTLGGFYFVNEFSDDILPMRNHILDLLNSPEALKISETEYLETLKEIEKSKELKEL